MRVARSPSDDRGAVVELVPRPRAPRTNVLPSLGAIVGREGVLARLEEEVANGSRLVTIVGAPGIGKTRVARAFVEGARSRFEGRGGAYFCDLSAARSEADLAFSILATVSVRAPEAAPLADVEGRLADVLGAAGPMLLVLDELERIAFAGPLLRRLCARAGDLVVIATSRERLSVDGETVVDLPPLALPERGAVDLSAGAARLFVSRAEQAGLRLGADDTRYVVEIVRRLDGIPLAIELVAARAHLHGTRELAARLARDRGALALPTRRRDEGRHATLASAILSSWTMLEDDERSLLARVSVFEGGFSLELLAATFGEDAVAVLGSLRDKSLVCANDRGRLSLYASIRSFAAERLAAEGAAAVATAREAHAAALSRLADAFVRSRNMPERVPTATPRFADLRGEGENLVAALAHAAIAGPSAAAARADLACAIALLYALPAEDMDRALSDALDALDEGTDTLRRASLLFARQGIRNALGRYDACLADLALLRTSPALPPELRVLASTYEGIQLRHQGRPEEALQRHHEAARGLAGLAFSRLSAMNDACIGRLMCDFGDVDRARDYNGRAFAYGEANGDVWLGALALANLAQLEQELGARAESRRLLERAYERLRDVGESHYEAIYASVLGDSFFEGGELATARRWYAHAGRFLSHFATHRQTGVLHASWASLEAAAGDPVEAARHLERARTCATHLENPIVRLVVALHAAAVDTRADLRGARDRGLARLEALGAPNGPDAPLHRTSLDVRFAARILRGALSATRPAGVGIRIDRTARSYVAPDGSTFGLARRGSLFRILHALAERRVRSDLRGLSVDELFAAGWPGERVLASAAQTRVRVAVATLRKLGLRTALVTRDDGYVLDPAVPIAYEA